MKFLLALAIVIPANSMDIVRDELGNSLPDYGSMKDITVCKPHALPTSGWGVNLSFNTKNSFGGYTGKRLYLVTYQEGRSSTIFLGSVNAVGNFADRMRAKMETCQKVDFEQFNSLQTNE